MTKPSHIIFISLLVIIVISVFIIISVRGSSYYSTQIMERVYHHDHSVLKPSGIIGHGLGIAGTLLMITGMLTYMARKRNRFMSRWGQLKHWLEFHIFLCTLGPIMILFHTAFKFGGLVAICFWSMVAVFLSGIIGRFIYIQIPRSIEGRELTLSEIRETKKDLARILKESFSLSGESFEIIQESVKRKIGVYEDNIILRYIRNRSEDRRSLRNVTLALRSEALPRNELKRIIKLVKDDISVNRKIERLDTMQNLFKYWHVAHLPFAYVMLVIMVIHVSVTLIFGYRWIF